MPLSYLSWLLFNLASPWQLSASLHYQTTCLNFKDLIHVFSRNINFWELLMALRSEQPARGFLLRCAGTPELQFLLAGTSAGGLQGQGVVEAVTKQDGQTVVGVFLATAPLCGARRSVLPLARVSLFSRVPAASRLGGPGPGETSPSGAAQGGHSLHVFLSQMWLLKSTEREIPLQPGEPSCPHSSLGPSKELRNPIPTHLL